MEGRCNIIEKSNFNYCVAYCIQLRLIAGEIEPDDGEIRIGEHVNIGYFSQDNDVLDGAISCFDNLRLTQASMTDIYRSARSMGIIEEYLHKLPGQLSRGQQAKLAFAKLLLSDYQLMVLDEPTNHLDITTREQIESALKNYQGAIIFASHDLYFAEAIGTTKHLTLTNGVLL